MKELWILRHAHAEPYRGDATDFDRHLDGRGQSEAAAIGRLCATLGIGFAAIVASPAARTLATARAVAAAQPEAPTFREDAAIYLAERRTLVDLVRALPPDAGRVLLVGHNPGVTRLVHWALDDERLGDLSPATLVGTRLGTDHWTDAGRGLFERLRVLRPEDALL